MYYLFVRHRVRDYEAWQSVFTSHADAQRKAGLHLLHCLRDADDPNCILMLFRADDPTRARAFTQTPGAREAKDTSGVIGSPEILILEDSRTPERPSGQELHNGM